MHSRLRFLKLWKLIERENAVSYMLFSLLSFVATVSIVRTFLALTGYPQIGGGTIHIAHVLWGGLILYIAAILPVIYLNPRLHLLGAILSGVGAGLFIDEVGKFITRQYDYFFPAAAPIIYVFFLLIVILVVMIRRPEPRDGRAELVQALEIVREQLYRPLEAAERIHVEHHMTEVMQTDPDKLHRDMASQLLVLVQSDPRTLPGKAPNRIVRIANRLKDRLTEPYLGWLIGIGMILLSMVMLKNPLQVWLEQVAPGSSLYAFLQSHAGRQIAPVEAPVLYHTRLILEVVIGITLLLSTGLLAAGRKRIAIILAFLCLLTSMAVLDMLLFYFEQFSTVLTVAFQFLLLFGLMYYRRKYIPPHKNP